MQEAKTTNFTMLVVIIYMITTAFFISYIHFNIPGMRITTTNNIIISQIVMQLIPVAVYFAMTRKKLSEVLLLNNPGFINCVLVILMAIIVQPLMMLLSAITNLFFVNNVANAVFDMFSGEENIIFVLLTVAAMPAVFEELMYRGVILSGYSNISKHKAALLSGFFFGIMHLNPQQFLYAFALGVVLGYIVIYSRSIFCSMLFHFTINGIQTLIVYATQFILPEEAETVVSEADLGQKLITILFMAVVSLFIAPLFAIAFLAFTKYNHKRNQSETAITIVAETENNIQSVLTPSFFAIIAVYVVYVGYIYILPQV